MMVNGKILLTASPAPTSSATLYDSPTFFYEFDYAANSFTQINAPAGILMDGAGALYFTDTGNNRIRRLSPQAAQPVSPPATR